MIKNPKELDVFSDPTGEDGHRDRLDKIAVTLKYMKDNYWENWKKYIRLFKGDHWGPYAAEDEQYFSSETPPVRITVNVIGPYINQLVAYVLSRDPYIRVKPLNADEVTNAMISESAVNFEWRNQKFKQALRKIAKTAYTIGWAPAKLGYTVELNKTANPSKDGFIEYNDAVELDAPFLKAISPFSFIYDLGASEKNLDTARWCCEIYHQDPAYVVNNEAYDPKVRAYIERSAGGRWGKPWVEAEYVSESSREKPDATKRLYTIYDFWDKKFRKRYIYCAGVTKPLLEETPDIWKPENHYIKGFPYKILPFIEDINEWFPIGLIKWIEMAQYELNRTRTAMFDYRRKTVGGQWEVDPDVVIEDERKKQQRGVSHILVPGAASGAKGFTPLQRDAFPVEQLQFDRVNMADIDMITGLSIIQGTPSPGRRAATEIRARSQYTSIRLDDIVSQMDDFVVDVAGDTIRHLKANYTSTRTHEIVGTMAEYWGRVTGTQPDASGKYWVEFTAEQISSNFGIEIDSTSKPKTDPSMERQDRMAFGNFLNSLGQFGVQVEMQSQGKITLQNMAGINMLEIAKWIGESYDCKEIARFIPSAAVIPKPLQEQTELAAQQGGQVPPATPSPMPPDQQNMMQQAVNPQSEALGRILGTRNMPGTGIEQS